MEIEESKWNSFKKYYFSKYKDFLSIVWYKLQGYTSKNIKERVNSIKKDDYSDLEAELKLYDIEDNTRKIINDCREVLYFPEVCNLYLFIGFFSPDAFVFKFKNHFVIAVGLERFHNFDNYAVLLAHEYCHYIQNMLIGEGKGNIKDRILREGISVYFSEIVYPDKKPWEYLFISRKKYYELQERYEYYLKMLNSGEFKNIDLFHGIINDPNVVFYPRAGYYIGYRLVKDYVKSLTYKNIDLIKIIKERDKILRPC